jgi:hypothetical protein
MASSAGECLQLLWASHTQSCNWFVFEALTADPMVNAAVLQELLPYMRFLAHITVGKLPAALCSKPDSRFYDKGC